MDTVSVLTSEYGEAANQEAGSQLTFSTPISGIDSTAYVSVDGIGGGSDVETDDDYRVGRTLFSIARVEDRLGRRDDALAHASRFIEEDHDLLREFSNIWIAVDSYVGLGIGRIPV
jgi:hypothetical protein